MNLVIFGAGEMAHIAYEYFTYDSDFDVIAFVVDDEYAVSEKFLELPLIKRSTFESEYDKSNFSLFVALTATEMNQDRKRVYEYFKTRNYTFASYISSKAFVWRNASIGENCFIFENNVIQPFVTVGDNCVLWSGNHIGHRTVIGNHVFISSHVVISGYCKVGSLSYFGVNSTVHDNIEIAQNCLVGAGAMISKNTLPDLVYVGSPARPIPNKLSSEVKF